jgi:uncharacterized protein (TIGR02217 family)
MAEFSWLEDDLFIDTRFPLELSTGATVSHEFLTLITRVDSGFETRNPRWDTPLRMYQLRTARSLEDLETLRNFYVVMRGRQRSFRFKDFQEYTSSVWDGVTTDANGAPAPAAITPLDQNLGTGDGLETIFQLRKAYTVAGNTIYRDITKPVAGTVRVSVNGSELLNSGSPSDFHVDHSTGLVYLNTAPTTGHAVTAGYEFDVPVRFDTDVLAAEFVSTIELEVPNVKLIEVRAS